MAHSNAGRDLQCIKHEAKIKIEKYMREDILFEYVRYMAGSIEITRHLWEIVQDCDTGIGYYSALLIVSEAGDIDRFPDSYHLCSYAGLIPSTCSSGG